MREFIIKKPSKEGILGGSMPVLEASISISDEIMAELEQKYRIVKSEANLISGIGMPSYHLERIES